MLWINKISISMRQFLRAPKTHGKTDGKVLYAIGRILIKCLVCILFLAKLIRENGILKIFPIQTASESFGKVRHNQIMARVYVMSITRSTMYKRAPFC